MSSKDSKTPQEVALVNALGDGGKKTVDFVRSELTANAKALQDAVDRFNQYVKTAEAKESDNTELLTTIHDALGKALGAHGAVATALNNGEQVSPATVAEVVKATEDVHTLEDEWKTKVDKTLEDHENRIGALEGLNKIPVLAPVPTLEPEVAPKSDVEVVEQKLDVTPAQTVRTQYINLQQWRGLALVLALVGFLIGGLITLSVWGGFFPGAMGVMAWVRYATLMVIPFISFFVGGSIGSYIESEQTRTVVA